MKAGNGENLYVNIMSDGRRIAIDNDTTAVATAICKYGVSSDLVIEDENGERIIMTYGIYIDKCYDSLYLETLRPILTEKQKNITNGM